MLFFNNGFDNKYDNVYKDYDDDYDHKYYKDDGYYDDNGYHSHSHHNKGYNMDYIEKIVAEFENNLHLLWDTYLSISTNHTSIGHRLDHVACTTTSPEAFKLVGPILHLLGGSTLHLRVELSVDNYIFTKSLVSHSHQQQ